MPQRNNLAEYRRTQVMGMSQAELVVMLCQGAIHYLDEAIDEVRAGRFDRSGHKFDRARSIVIHLYGTIDPAAGEVTTKLSALYAFVIDQITIANAQRDVGCAEICLQILTNLKEGWEQLVAHEANASNAAPPATELAATVSAVPGTRSFCYPTRNPMEPVFAGED